MALYIWHEVGSYNHGQRTTHTMQDDSLTRVVQCPVPCPFFRNHHAILCTNTTPV